VCNNFKLNYRIFINPVFLPFEVVLGGIVLVIGKLIIGIVRDVYNTCYIYTSLVL